VARRRRKELELVNMIPPIYISCASAKINQEERSWKAKAEKIALTII
jgi:hypothetical protein